VLAILLTAHLKLDASQVAKALHDVPNATSNITSLISV
jgi:hypothetical protein